MRRLVAFLLIAAGCATPVPFSLDQTPRCEELSCPPGHRCRVLFGQEYCVMNRPMVDICSLRCPPDSECRYGACISVNPTGKVCEFDEACVPGELCIQGRCTAVSCEPGDSYLCYSGPIETAGTGECRYGFRLCTQDLEYTTECIGEITPRQEVGFLACNGRDDDCDGRSDSGSLAAVDLIFAYDISGSMLEEIPSVVEAVTSTAPMYNDENVRLGLEIFPGGTMTDDAWRPMTVIALTDYDAFELVLSIAANILSASFGSREASWDVPVLIANGLQDGMILNPAATPVLVMFTDEPGQSYMDHRNDEASMCEAVRAVGMKLFVLAEEENYGDFDDCATIFPLERDNPEAMVANLSHIVESVCN